MTSKHTRTKPAQRINRRPIGPMALEQRFMFDGAAVATAVEAVVDQPFIKDAVDPSVKAALQEAATGVATQDQDSGISINEVVNTQADVVAGVDKLGDTAQQQWALSQSETAAALANLAQRADFDALMRDIFARSGTDSATFDANLANLKADLIAGKLSVPIELRTDSEMQGLMAAYAAQGPDGKERIYVNAAWLEFGAGSGWITQVMLEEYGHAIDQRLNGLQDSPGDEGELFAARLLGMELDATQTARMQTESDFGYLNIDGVSVQVQHASFNFVNAYAVYTGAVGGNTFLADKEQNRHHITFTSLNVASIADGTNGLNFSGNDVSVDLVIGGTHYYGWISRPIKDGGVVKGFYFWKDADFANLNQAQVDGNADSDGSAADNSGFILVVDQSYFTNLAYAGGGSTYKFVNSSSDRVDSSLNSLVTSNAAPVAVADVSDLNLAAGASGGPAQELGFSVATVNATGNVLTNDTDANIADSKTVTKIGVSSAGMNVASATTSLNGTSVVGSYGTLTIGADGTYSYVVDNNNAAVNALRTTANSLADVFTYTMKDGAGSTSSTSLTVKIIGANDAPVANKDYNTAKEHTTPTDTGYNATGDVLANDTDVDSGDTKTISGITQIGDATAASIVSTTTQSVIRFDASSEPSFNKNTVETKNLFLSVSGTYRAVRGSNDAQIYAISGGTTDANNDKIWDVKLSQDVYYYLVGTTKTYLTLAELSGRTVLFSDATTETKVAASNEKTAVLTSTESTGTYTVDLNSYNGSIAVGAALWYDNDATSAVNYVDSLLTVQSITYDAYGLPTKVSLNGRIPFANGTAIQFRSSLSVGTTYTGQYGTLNLAADGSYTYTPGTNISSINAGDTVVEVFDYTMQDTAGVTSSSKLYITVYGDGSNSPIPGSDTGTAYEAGVGRSSSSPYGLTSNGTSFSGVNATGDVLANDTLGTSGTTATVTDYSLSDGSGTVSAGSSLTGTYGALSIASTGGFTYIVDDNNATVNALLPGQTLTETFWYTLTNSSSLTGKTKLVITIQGTNDAPAGVDDTGETLIEDVTTSTTGNVLVNDTDVDTADSKSVTKVIAGIATPTATVAANSSMTTSGTTVDGTYGRLIIGSDGSYSYTLGVTSSQITAVQALRTIDHPTETFSYELTDSYGATSTAKLTFSVDGTGEAPVNKVNGSSFSSTSTLTYTTAMNTALVFTGSKALSVTDADSNLSSVKLTVENGSLSFTSSPTGVSLSGATGATITITGTESDINAALLLLQYTPTNNYTGNDYLTIASKDADNLWDIDGIAINIPKVYSGPTVREADLSTGSTPSGTFETNSVTLTAPTNHTFGSVDQSGSGTYGTWSLNKTTGAFSYTLTQAPSVNGSSTTDSISILSYDTYGNSVTNTVTVTITDDAPTANADVRSVNEGTVASPASNLTGNVLASGATGDVQDTKGADTPVTVTRVILGNATPTTTVAASSTSASNGTPVAGNYGSLVIGANGSYIYGLDDTNSTVDALNNGGTLTEEFTYEITDSDGDTSTATLSITINGTTDAAITVSSPTVNEASQYAVFSVGVSSGQNLTLALGGGTATGIGTDYGVASDSSLTPNLEYSLDNGTTWTRYTVAFNATLSGGVTALLVRTSINNDSVSDNGETFELSVTPTGGTAVLGTATIKDDGTGDIFNSNGSTNSSAQKDDDRALSVGSFFVNEGSPYAVFTVTGAAGQLASLTLTNGTSTGLSGLQYYAPTNPNADANGWVTYSSGTVALNGSGELLVRTSLTPEQEAGVDNGETFTLKATNTGGSDATGTATIKDDGTGNYYAANNTTGTSSVPAGSSLDDDRLLTVNTISLNEASPTVVFTVTGAAGQYVKLDLQETTSVAGNAVLNSDTGNVPTRSVPLQYSNDNGTTWSDYNTASFVQMSSTSLLIRTGITNDNTYEGAETFKLVATNTGGTPSTGGIATIYDDGTGTIFNDNGTSNTTAKKDDDRSLKINSILINEDSSWGVFRVEGAPGQRLSLVLLQDSGSSGAGGSGGSGGVATLGQDTAYFDAGNTVVLQTYNGTTWVDYRSGDVVTYPSGSSMLLVRVKIANDGTLSNGVWEGPETFTVAVEDSSGLRAVGVGTIVDDGNGIIFRENGSENTNVIRDDDRVLKINSIMVNEGSPKAVFTVTAPTGVPLTISLQDGSAKGSTNLVSPNGLNDYGTALEIFNGSTWEPYNPSNLPQLTANVSGVGTLYVRVAIANDSVKEDTESFTLQVQAGGSTATGQCLIKDDGTGSYWIGDATQAATSAQLVAANLMLDDDFDLDGIAPTTEEQLATLAASQGFGSTGDLNNDGVQDALQNALATLAWVKVEDFQAALDGSLTSIKPIVTVSAVTQDLQGNWAADDTKYQLQAIEVIQASSLDNGLGTVPDTFNGAPLSAPWDPIRFTVTDASNAALLDVDANRAGTQVVIYIDIARAGLTLQDVNAYVKYVSQDAVNAANGTLVDLDGKVVRSAGWYDFTQRKNSAGQYAGDGARFVLAADGRTIMGISITLTDNAFGDNDARVGYVLDPGMPVKVGDLPPPSAPAYSMGEIVLKPQERQDNWVFAAPREPIRFDSSLFPLNARFEAEDLRLTEPVDVTLNERSPLAQWARYFDTYAPQGDWRMSVIPAEQESLSVFRGMPDQFAELGRQNTIIVPWDAFVHTTAQAQVILTAQLQDGGALPAWVQFDAKKGKFVVQAPAGVRSELLIKLTARDAQGREATTLFKLHVSEKDTTATDKPGRAGLSEQLHATARARQPSAYSLALSSLVN